MEERRRRCAKLMLCASRRRSNTLAIVVSRDDDDGVNLDAWLGGGALGRLSARQVITPESALPTLRRAPCPTTSLYLLCNNPK